VVKAWKNHNSTLGTMPVMMMIKKILHDAILTVRLCGKSSYISCLKKDKTILRSTFATHDFAFAKMQRY
jgi:hypothetical protein